MVQAWKAHCEATPGASRPSTRPRHAAAGRAGDISIVELVEGPVKLVDTQKNEITGKAYLKPFETVGAGVPFGRPYPLPFSVPA